MKINVIAACDSNGVIGVNGRLPWHIPEDLKRFRGLTTGRPIIMGRKTWESLPKKPLPNRMNIVVAAAGASLDGATRVSSLIDALRFLEHRGSPECFIIGGGSIYRPAIEVADTIYLTEVAEPVVVEDGDSVSHFPLHRINQDWKLMEMDVRLHFTFKTYERVA